MRYPSACFLLAALAGTAAAVAAEPTELTVRVISKGAKFIGTSMGGVRILVKDHHTGEILARGVTSGGTGDTQRVMDRPLARGQTRATEGAAKFHTTLDLDMPRRVTVVATGPLAQLQGMNTVTATQWVVPGEHITGGGGWVLEMPGLIVDVIAPAAHQVFEQEAKSERIEVTANVTMMCGCPIKPAPGRQAADSEQDDTAYWPPEDFEVKAIVARNEEPFGEYELAYAGRPSLFTGDLEADEQGAYEVTVYAYQPENGNTGLGRTTFIVK